MVKHVSCDLNESEVDYTEVEYFNLLLKELELFSKVNNIDIDINIFDKVNNNTKLVVDIEN